MLEAITLFRCSSAAAQGHTIQLSISGSRLGHAADVRPISSIRCLQHTSAPCPGLILTRARLNPGTMNVFRKNKKAKEQAEFEPTAEAPTQSKATRSFTRKRKNNVPAPLPQVETSIALPDTKDFRTSLLMPGLSARFSMLREQDDPSSMLGKASDDSVLFPKRASRLNLFSHNPLTDIAEVESIRSSFRPPFAHNERTYSMSDGYASDDGASVMGRSRPGEGNTLFGGRQKLYRVPAGAASSASSNTITEAQRSSDTGLGKHVYGDDVSLSLFQQYRAQAREEEANAVEAGPGDEPEINHAGQSQFDAFSKNRGTTSSTTSGPSNRRTSTAATSVSSESPLPRQNSGQANGPAKTHTSDLANGVEDNYMRRNPSSESRRNFAVRDNAATPPMPSPSGLSHKLSQSRSAVNLNDRYGRPGPFSTTTFRAVSPPLSNTQAIASLDLGLQDKRTSSQARRYQTASPTSPSPVGEEGDNFYSSALQPNDRGKATAMGLFNRPQQRFDEQQFLQRQRQMQSSPFSTDGRSDSRASPEPTSAALRRNESAQGVSAPSPSFDAPSTNAAPSPQPKTSQTFTSPTKAEVIKRARQQSSASSITHSAPQNVKARVESLIRRQNAELAAIEAELNVGKRNARKVSESSESLNQSSQGTFFNNFDASDDESESIPRKTSPPRIATTDIHPAFRDGTNDFDFGDSPALTPRINQRHSDASEASIPPSNHTKHNSAQNEGGDSPTLGPPGLGLSGMIRTHLRHDSDKSSIYPPSPAEPVFHHTAGGRELSAASTTRTNGPPESIHSDPWEFDDATRRPARPSIDQKASAAPPTMSQKAQQILGHAGAHRPSQQSKAQRILGNEAPNKPEDTLPERSWHDEMAASHRRGASTETQQERQAFDDDLAERRRRIQEKMKDNSESEVRSRSPGRTMPGAQMLAGLRHKTSKGNMAPPPDRAPKAMKMLGITEPVNDLSSPNPGMDGGYEQNHGHQAPGPGRRQYPRPGPPPSDSAYENGRRTPVGSRPPQQGPNGSYEEFERQRQRSATPNGGRGPGRNRAMSEAADRSKSRNGRYRDDDYPPMDGRQGVDSRQGYRGGVDSRQGHRAGMDSRQGNRSGMDNRQGNRVGMDSRQGMHSRQGHSPSPPHMRRTPEEEHGAYDRSASAMSGRMRSDSRAQAPGYFDNRGPPPNGMPHPNGHHGPPRSSPRPPIPQSPMRPFQGQPSPAYAPSHSVDSSTMQSPALNSYPYSDDVSGRYTVTNGRTTPASSRKKSFNKNMISEPQFVSSTSSVPLVGLPGGQFGSRPQAIGSPAIPPMNPERERRRAGTASDRNTPSPFGAPSSAFPSPLPMAHDSAYGSAPDLATTAAQHAYNKVPEQYQGKPPPRARNRLRKTSSEGGNMASRARQQAMALEAERSPAIPHGAGMFPNRSATSLGFGQSEGQMF